MITAPIFPAATRPAVTFVLITVFLDMVGFGIIIPVLPRLIGEIGHVGLDRASVIGGWMAFVYSAMQFLFSPLMGNLADRFGRRPLLLLAVAGLMVDYLLQAWAPTLIWLFLGRALAGFCGASWVIANAYIADVTAPADRAAAFGRMGAAFGLGFVIGPAIGGLLGELGPRVPFMVAAAISALNLIYGWFVLPETLPADRRRPFEAARANPFGAFRVFASYRGVLPLCLVLFLFFFASSVYPAIWPYWGMAKFGWSEWVVGITLAVFGVIMAVFQGLGTGLAVKWLGEAQVVIAGLVSATLAATGYGFAWGLVPVVLLMVVHGPEGFIHPMLTAMMSKAVPDDAQGELQGGVSAIMNVAMLAGTLFFAQVFGHFMSPARANPSPDTAFHIAGGLLFATLLLYLAVRPKPADAPDPDRP